MVKTLTAAQVLAKVRPGDALAWPPEHKSKALVIGQDFYGQGGMGSSPQRQRQQRTGLYLEDKYGNSYTMRFSDSAPEGGGHAEGMGHVPSPQSRPGTEYVAITSDSNHTTYPVFKREVEWFPGEGRVKRPLEGGSEHYEYRSREESRDAPDPGIDLGF
jgi:hypothetical protein